MIATDSTEAARSAGLSYTSDQSPGYRRKRRGQRFNYISKDGRLLQNQAEIRRIKALVIPPAWEEVWICQNPNGHLQATGRDARGRKQYRYHARWRAVRDEAKYASLSAFAEKLPLIRKQVRKTCGFRACQSGKCWLLWFNSWSRH
jgi:DNA topoisomerase-1